MIDELLTSEEMLSFESAPNSKAYAFMFVHYSNPCHIYDNINNICHCMTICHDKDTKPGSLERVKPHYHTIVVFKNPRHLSAMRKVCKTLSEYSGSNVFVKPCHSLAKAAEYALHQTAECLEDADKHMYTYEDAVFDSDVFWSKVINGSDDAFNEEFVRDLLTLEPIKMAYKYGKDYIRNYERYEYFRTNVKEEFGSFDTLRISEPTDFSYFKSSMSNYYLRKEMENN